MALIKFNRSATKATATGSSRDADTLYFPTDEQAVYLNGKRVGGDAVSSAETAGYATEAGQVTHTLSVKKGSTTTTYNGSIDATITIPTTPSEVGAAPSNHTHDIDNITHAGEAAKMGVDTYISNAPSSSNLPTSNAVKDYIDRQIKNYTSAFRYAGNLVKKSNDAWQINDIPSDISGNVGNIYMDFDTFVGSSEDDSLLETGFTFYVMSDGTFNLEQVEPGDMVTCVGLYNGEGTWEPSYNIVNSNITVIEQVDDSTKVPTAGAVKSAITSAINGLNSDVTALENYVLTSVVERNGQLTSASQVPIDQTYSSTSSNPASGKSIANAIATLGSTKSASSGKAITSITQENGVITAITESDVNLTELYNALTWK